MKSGTITIGPLKIKTLFAISQQEQQTGLMHQEWPPPVMSFIYDKPSFNSFWMKNTPSPLDIVFCCNGKITEIYKGEPNSIKIIGGRQPSDLVIELPYGTCQAYNININDNILIND